MGLWDSVWIARQEKPLNEIAANTAAMVRLLEEIHDQLLKLRVDMSDYARPYKR
jgi:hypothetical protein